MNKINKILACIDFSEYSLMTLEYAVELAKGKGIPPFPGTCCQRPG